MPLPHSSTPPRDWLMAGMGALGGLVGSPVSAGTELVSGQVGVDSDLVGVSSGRALGLVGATLGPGPVSAVVPALVVRLASVVVRVEDSAAAAASVARLAVP